MKLLVSHFHQGEGKFPTFSAGTAVRLGSECVNYPNWFACEIDGWKTFVPSHFISENKLICDYNPTELVAAQGERVELLELHYQWAIVKRENEIGWLPCEILRVIG
ncbi:TPA: hypothetical protein ACU21B_001626 [Mannheimia haemolytica]